ncbi:MAG: hypothetical protein IPG50_38060 [Myxococcales bacterium]|nr:hypothetical protein [Myxococcales bacterium]
MTAKKSPPWVLIAVLALVAVVVIGGLVVGGFVIYFMSQKDTLVAEGKAARSEGASAGRSRDRDQCVDEALLRNDACGVAAISCEVKNGMFLEGCLDTARPGRDFCVAVPRHEEIVKGSVWLQRECAKRGRAQVLSCTRLLQTVQKRCHREPAPAARE